MLAPMFAFVRSENRRLAEQAGQRPTASSPRTDEVATRSPSPRIQLTTRMSKATLVSTRPPASRSIASGQTPLTKAGGLSFSAWESYHGPVGSRMRRPETSGSARTRAMYPRPSIRK